MTNKRFVHVELCETADYTKFKRAMINMLSY